MIRVVCQEVDGSPVAQLGERALVMTRTFDVNAAEVEAWLREAMRDEPKGFLTRQITGWEVRDGQAAAAAAAPELVAQAPAAPAGATRQGLDELSVFLRWVSFGIFDKEHSQVAMKLAEMVEQWAKEGP